MWGIVAPVGRVLAMPYAPAALPMSSRHVGASMLPDVIGAYGDENGPVQEPKGEGAELVVSNGFTVPAGGIKAERSQCRV